MELLDLVVRIHKKAPSVNQTGLGREEESLDRAEGLLMRGCVSSPTTAMQFLKEVVILKVFQGVGWCGVVFDDFKLLPFCVGFVHHNRDRHVFVSCDARFGRTAAHVLPVTLFNLDSDRDFDRSVVPVASGDDIAANLQLFAVIRDTVERHPCNNELAWITKKFGDHIHSCGSTIKNPLLAHSIPASALFFEKAVVGQAVRALDGDFVDSFDDVNLWFHGVFIRFGQKNSGNLPLLPLTSESVLGFVRVPWILPLTSFEEVLHVSCVVADYPWADIRRLEVTARLTAF